MVLTMLLLGDIATDIPRHPGRIAADDVEAAERALSTMKDNIRAHLQERADTELPVGLFDPAADIAEAPTRCARQPGTLTTPMP